MRNFHDAVIIAVHSTPTTISIQIESVSNHTHEPAMLEQGDLLVEGWTTVTMDGNDIDPGTIGAGFDDGQILKLTFADCRLWMLVEWTRYTTREKRVTEYSIVGREVVWRPREGDEEAAPPGTPLP